MFRIDRFLIIAVFFLSLAGCSVNSSQKKMLTVSILPQKYFVTKIAGDRFDVNVMIPPGHSPATYEASARQLQRLESSLIYFRIGHIPFENANIDRIRAANKKMLIVDTSKGAELIGGTAHDHDHGEEGDHHRAGIDPHIWLSPSEVKTVCRNMLNAIVAVDPENKAVYDSNYRDFIGEIDELDKSIKKSLSPYKGRSFLIFHPSWTYFARDYNIIQVPIEFEGKSPSPAWMKKIIDLAEREKIRVIFIQKQFSSGIAGGISGDIKGTVYQPDPLRENWLEGMRESSELFSKAFKEGYGE